MGLLKQCEKWHEQDEHRKIIDALEAVPEELRTADIDMELARAYNNEGNPDTLEGRNMLKEAVRLMQTHESELSETYSWNFRMGYAYFYLDEEGRAIEYFEKALELHPGDDPKLNTRQEIEDFIAYCHKFITLPQFKNNFRERTAVAWEAFANNEEKLRIIMDEDENHERGAEIVAMCEDILALAFEEIAFEIGLNDSKYEIILTPEGNRVNLFELVYFQKHAPAEVLKHWNIVVGRQPAANMGIRIDDLDIAGEDVCVWLKQSEENRFEISAYCEKLQKLLNDDINRVWWILTTLTDRILGEIPHMRLIDAFDVLDAPKEEEFILLSDLLDELRGRGAELSIDPESYLESYTAYELKPIEDPDADLRLDTVVGSTACVPLINEYLCGENEYMNELHSDGAVGGFFCYPLDGFDGENRSQQIFDFRDKLEERLTSDDALEALTFIGGATGLYYGYVDFIAWDLEKALNIGKEFFDDTDLEWAGFHVFRRDAGTVFLKGRGKTDGGENGALPDSSLNIHEETGSLLSQEDIEILDSFDEGVSGYFGKMLRWIEDFVESGVQEGRFTEEQARRDLKIALWYAFACNNLDEYYYYYQAAQWMPASEENAKGCAMWYYRYSVALMYCGRLNEALEYAIKGAKEEPDYPWVWLQVGKLLSHFGDKSGAIEACEHGLALEPGDYEFLTLKREIEAGDTLEQMEYHWINPEADQALQQGLDEDADDKLRSISCIRVDNEGLDRFWEIFGQNSDNYIKDDPYCHFRYMIREQWVELVFRMNEAGMSKLKTEWLEKINTRLMDGSLLVYDVSEDLFGILDTVMINLDCSTELIYKLPDDDRYFRIFLNPDGTINEDAHRMEADAAVGEQGGSENKGVFVGFVLLSEAEWDKQQFIRDLKDKWNITVEENGGEEKRDDSLIFETGNMMAAASLIPAPVPDGEAEINAENNYMWPDAVETAKNHKAHIIVAVLNRGEEDLIERGKLYAKLMAACCRQKYATGVYTSGVVFEPHFYEDFADVMKTGDLPLYNWIWFGLYKGERGMCAYTYGMDLFGKEEMEVLNADAEPKELYDFLSGIAAYVLEYDVEFESGETVGFSETDKHSIIRSEGVALPGMTLKISYEPAESNSENTKGNKDFSAGLIN